MNTQHSLLLQTIKAALEAGKTILEVYYSKNIAVEIKDDNSPLTLADKKSHAAICRTLQNTDIPILSEEGKDIDFAIRKNWQKLWIVDPLDGTKEFLKRNGEFTVNIALVEYQQPVLGVIYSPVSKILYFAQKNLGSYKLSSATEYNTIEEYLAHVEKLPYTKTNTYTIVASRSHMNKETEEFIAKKKADNPSIELVSMGSSLKICLVAEGRADCYPRFAPTMEWDTAAGQAIAEAAGKKFVDISTQQSMLYNKANLLNNWFLVE